DPCVNGGRWTGVACLCPPNTDGARCEFGATTINLTAELGPSVTMMARVTNRDFSEDMTDASSPRHRRFAEEFSRTVRPQRPQAPTLSPPSRGSVVVNYRVRLRPLPGNASLEHRALELLAVANAASRPHDCSPSAGRGWGQGTLDRSLASPELCRRNAPANFSRFYFPYRTANGLLCVTNCTLNVPGSFDCHRG
ncbi:MUC3B protein, partial [Rhabdornis inornatus]|nr:MUC3B protein [Rhabdornis inornatus]